MFVDYIITYKFGCGAGWKTPTQIWPKITFLHHGQTSEKRLEICCLHLQWSPFCPLFRLYQCLGTSGTLLFSLLRLAREESLLPRRPEDRRIPPLSEARLRLDLQILIKPFISTVSLKKLVGWAMKMFDLLKNNNLHSWLMLFSVNNTLVRQYDVVNAEQNQGLVKSFLPLFSCLQLCSIFSAPQPCMWLTTKDSLLKLFRLFKLWHLTKKGFYIMF